MRGNRRELEFGAGKSGGFISGHPFGILFSMLLAIQGCALFAYGSHRLHLGTQKLLFR